MIPNRFGENDGRMPGARQTGGDAALSAWVLDKVNHARQVRDQKYGKRWKEYTRLWRGFWSEDDKNTDSERSRLIAPALSQAIEMTASEIEEAIFAKKAWFDVTDDIADENKDDAVSYRDQLLEDFELDGVPRAVSHATLLGTIYGTGIAKINVTEKTEMQTDPQSGQAVEVARTSVFLEAVRPDEFLIDPSAIDIDGALFVAHEMVVPKHRIAAKQRSGLYKKFELGTYSGERPSTDGTHLTASVDSRDEAVKIVEYAGKVPSYMAPGGGGSKGMTEVLVTMTHDGKVLRARANPYTMKDRPFIAYQHENVPGEFWGRGVAEKGYHPQKALDAEMRARVDALALLSAPMMGADISRLPRNTDYRVRPGRTIFTRGRPTEILEPISFGSPAILTNTFQHAGDLERMVQMGTGAMDSATPVGVNARNETSSGISQLQAGFIKRAKRTMQNIERQFLGPLVRKSLWRYMQFDPQRYTVDMKFRIDSAMGIMAKEVENTLLTHLMGYIPDDAREERMLVMKAIFDNSAAANKPELMQAIQQMTAPPTPEEQQAQQRQQQIQQQLIEVQLRKESAEAAESEAKAAKAQAETEKVRAEADLAIARAEYERVKAELEDDKVQIQASNAAVAAEKVRVSQQDVRNKARDAQLKRRKEAQSSNGQ